MLEQHVDLKPAATERACICKKNHMLMKGDKNWTYTRLLFRSSKTIGDNDTDAEKTIRKTPSSILSLSTSFLPTFFSTILYDQCTTSNSKIYNYNTSCSGRIYLNIPVIKSALGPGDQVICVTRILVFGVMTPCSLVEVYQG